MMMPARGFVVLAALCHLIAISDAASGSCSYDGEGTCVPSQQTLGLIASASSSSPIDKAVISSATEEAICNDLKTAAACKAPCAWNPNSATPYCSSPTYFANVDCMSTDNSLSPFCSVPLAIVTNCNSTKSEKTCNGFGYCLYMAVGSDGACMLNYNNMPSVFQAMGKIASQAYPSAVVLPAMYSALGGCAAHNTAASCAGATLALGIEPKTGSSSGMVSDSKAPPPKNAAGSSRRGAGQLPAAAAALLAAAVLLVL